MLAQNLSTGTQKFRWPKPNFMSSGIGDIYRTGGVRPVWLGSPPVCRMYVAHSIGSSRRRTVSSREGYRERLSEHTARQDSGTTDLCSRSGSTSPKDHGLCRSIQCQDLRASPPRFSYSTAPDPTGGRKEAFM